jgi:hypothetical protein
VRGIDRRVRVEGEIEGEEQTYLLRAPLSLCCCLRKRSCAVINTKNLKCNLIKNKNKIIFFFFNECRKEIVGRGKIKNITGNVCKEVAEIMQRGMQRDTKI